MTALTILPKFIYSIFHKFVNLYLINFKKKGIYRNNLHVQVYLVSTEIIRIKIAGRLVKFSSDIVYTCACN